ncbi:MAG: hypothetical protein VW338_15325 [Rhodospirillaceae bacterium]
MIRMLLLLLAVLAGMVRPAQAEERQLVKLPEMMREHMAPFMPDAMKQIGTSMHRAASRFARLAEVADLDPTPAGARKVQPLQEITAACAGCHGAFRVH